jgi:hypothetical protein
LVGNTKLNNNNYSENYYYGDTNNDYDFEFEEDSFLDDYGSDYDEYDSDGEDYDDGLDYLYIDDSNFYKHELYSFSNYPEQDNFLDNNFNLDNFYIDEYSFYDDFGFGENYF